MILDLTLEGSKWIEPPWKFEAGTPMVAEAIGLRAAVDYLEEIGMEAIRQHEKKLVNYALKEFAKIEDFHLYGELGPERHTATFSFNIGDSRGGIIHPHDVGTYFDSLGLAIRAGHHCAKPLMRRFKVVSMSRASCYLYNSESDIDKLVDAIHKARKFFTGV
jgi:cysteine desulfurase/selenocysteine lyase